MCRFHNEVSFFLFFDTSCPGKPII
jgi:hypothetical protein